MRIPVVSCFIMFLSFASFAQDQVAIQVGSTCRVELKKYGVILPMPCDAVKDSTAAKIIFKKEYFHDGAMAGYVYITVSPNKHQTLADIDVLRKEMLDTYRKTAAELGLSTQLSEVRQERSQSETHLELAARSFPTLEDNPNFKYMYFYDVILGKDTKVQYEMLAPYNERVVHQLREMVLKIDWLSKSHKDSKTGLSMMIPGGDWKATANPAGTGVLLQPHYLWEKMYTNPRDRYPEVQIIATPSYLALGLEKAVTQVKSRMEQKGGSVVEDEEIGVNNATNARFILGKFPAEGRFYDQEYIWLLQLPGNKFVEVIMKATCNEYGCRGQYDVLPLLEKVVIESIKY